MVQQDAKPAISIHGKLSEHSNFQNNLNLPELRQHSRTDDAAVSATLSS
jgi:hypothetical protein